MGTTCTKQNVQTVRLSYCQTYCQLYYNQYEYLARLVHVLSKKDAVTKIISEYDQKIPQQTRGIARNSHTTITSHQEDKHSTATSSLFPIKMIAKLDGHKATHNKI